MVRIILSNDDGFEFEGLKILYELVDELFTNKEIIVAAPDTEKSASSNAMTLHGTIKVEEKQFEKSKGFKIKGTPVDCAKFALFNIFEGNVDFIFSGINKGPNLGTDILYSGTVAAATEAAIIGKTGFALSFATENLRFNNFSNIRKHKNIILNLLKKLISLNLNGVVFNINIPDIEIIKGIKVVFMDNFYWKDYYVKVGENEYKITGTINASSNFQNTDYEQFKKGFITVTPLHFNLTYKELTPVLKEKLNESFNN